MTALARGLTVLRTFADNDEQSPSEIARRTNLPQATVWRICRTLVDTGYLTRIEGSDNLRAGPPIRGLGNTLLAGLPILDVARDRLPVLQREFSGAVTVAARCGMDMLCLHRIEGEAVFSATTYPGRTLPLFRSSAGWAHMAGLPIEDRQAEFAAFDADPPEGWLENRPFILEAAERFSRDGYVVNKGMLHAAINAVAVPVWDPGRRELYSISCGGLAAAFDEEVLRHAGERLVAVSSEIGRDLAMAAASAAKTKRKPA